MAFPRKNTGTSSNGFVRASRDDGTSRWMRTPPRANSISFLAKLKLNRQKACFASGLPKSEIRCHPAVLGTLSGVAIRGTRTGRQELSRLATEPASSLAPFPALAGKRRSLQHPRRRSLPRPRQAKRRENDLGLDRHTFGVRPGGWLLRCASASGHTGKLAARQPAHGNLTLPAKLR